MTFEPSSLQGGQHLFGSLAGGSMAPTLETKEAGNHRKPLETNIECSVAANFGHHLLSKSFERTFFLLAPGIL